MLKSFLYLCGLALVACMISTGYAADKPAKIKGSKMGKIRHVVAFKFKETATPEDIKKVETSFGELKNKIPQIVTFEFGTNTSPEKRNKGFTHCFLLTFKTEKDRDDYLVHPDHKAFGASIGALVDDVFVFDYTATK